MERIQITAFLIEEELEVRTLEFQIQRTARENSIRLKNSLNCRDQLMCIKQYTPNFLILLYQTSFTATSMAPSQNRRFTLTTHMSPLSALAVAFATFGSGLCFVFL